VKGKAHLVAAQHMGESFATDPDLTLPSHPRIVPELIFVPVGEDALMAVGAEAPQVFRGRSARGLLPRFLPLLDGHHTMTELIQGQRGLSPDDVMNLVSLLFSRGMLENGASDAESGRSAVASFIGRHIDVSRQHTEVGAVMRLLAAAHVAVDGPTRLAKQLADDLAASGIGTVRVGTAAEEPGSLTVVVSVGSDPIPPSRSAPAPGAKTLFVRLGCTEAHIGPVLTEGLTACPECLTRVYPHPLGHPDDIRAMFWMGTASLLAFLEFTQLPPGLSLRGMRVQRFGPDGLVEDIRPAVRLPGCSRCGIEGEKWSPGDPRMVAWIYHSVTSLASREQLSPRDHQAHYLAEYSKLALEDKRLLWTASTEALGLAAARSGDTRLTPPSVDEGPPRVTIQVLSDLLSRIAGQVGSEAHYRRLVPTGGNLGSVLLYVIAREVVGLAPGAYLYDGHRSTLDFIRSVEDRQLGEALNDNALTDCIVVGAGAMAKCAEKYQAFAFRLIHLDAGVALAYAHLAARTLGLYVREYPDFSINLPGIFGVPRRWELPWPTFALGISASTQLAGNRRDGGRSLGPQPATESDDYSFDVLGHFLDVLAESPCEPTDWPPEDRALPAPAWTGSIARLDEVLTTRRAVRTFSRVTPEAQALRATMIATTHATRRRLSSGAAPSFVEPVLAIALGTDDLPSGIYGWDAGDQALTRRGEFNARLSLECTNQTALAAAPVTIFLIGNLRSALTRRGARGYPELAMHAGAAVGAAWLTATSLGLVGTAAGGVVAGGLKRAANMDGFNACPLLALHLGLPVEGHS
jgi:SagB-type dehydrogenase family enzyme